MLQTFKKHTDTIIYCFLVLWTIGCVFRKYLMFRCRLLFRKFNNNTFPLFFFQRPNQLNARGAGAGLTEFRGFIDPHSSPPGPKSSSRRRWVRNSSWINYWIGRRWWWSLHVHVYVVTLFRMWMGVIYNAPYTSFDSEIGSLTVVSKLLLAI